MTHVKKVVMDIVLKQQENVLHVTQVMDMLMVTVINVKLELIHHLEVQHHVNHAVHHHGQMLEHHHVQLVQDVLSVDQLLELVHHVKQVIN